MKKLAIGIDDFKLLREQDSYFVTDARLIANYDIIVYYPSRVFFFCL